MRTVRISTHVDLQKTQEKDHGIKDGHKKLFEKVDLQLQNFYVSFETKSVRSSASNL